MKLLVLVILFNYLFVLSEEDMNKILNLKIYCKQKQIDSVINVLYTSYDSCFFISNKKNIIRNDAIEKLMYDTHKNLIKVSRKFQSAIYFIDYFKIKDIWYVDFNRYNNKSKFVSVLLRYKIKDGKIIAINPFPEFSEEYINYEDYLNSYEDELDGDIDFDDDFN